MNDGSTKSRITPDLVKDGLIIGLGQAVRSIVRILSMILMSRYMTPEEVGPFSIGLVTGSVLGILAGTSIVTVIISESTLSRNEQRSCTGLMMTTHLFWLGVSFFGIAPFLESFFRIDGIAFAVRFMSCTAVVDGFIRLVPESVLFSQQKFKKIALADLLALLASSTVGIYLAVHGNGINSFFYREVVLVFVYGIILTFLSKAWPIPSFNFKIIANILRPTARLTSSGLLAYTSILLPRYFLANSAGISSVGWFSRGHDLQNSLENSLRPVVTPYFVSISKMRHQIDDAIDLVKHTIRILAYPGFILFVGLAVLANDLVYVAMGPQWSDTGTVLSILACSGVLMLTENLLIRSFVALGHSREHQRWSIFKAIAMVFSVAITTPYGGIALAIGISATIMAYRILMIIYFASFFKRSVASFFLEVRRPFLISLFLATNMLSVSTIPGISEQLRLISGITIGAATLVFSYVVFPAFHNDIKSIFQMLTQRNQSTIEETSILKKSA